MKLQPLEVMVFNYLRSNPETEVHHLFGSGFAQFLSLLVPKWTIQEAGVLVSTTPAL